MDRLKRIGLVAWGLVALSALPVAAQESIAGKWLLTADSPQGSMASEFVFEQEGSVVSGTVSIDVVDAAEISDGLFEEGVLSFLLHVSMEGQYFTAQVEAEVDGDQMVGEFYVPEMGQGIPFVGRRADN